jgi:hypothetical protein
MTAESAAACDDIGLASASKTAVKIIAIGGFIAVQLLSNS